MRAKVRAGRLDGAAVDAVLEAAGPRVPRRREALSGLGERAGRLGEIADFIVHRQR